MKSEILKLLIATGHLPAPPPPEVILESSITDQAGVIHNCVVLNGFSYEMLEECNEWPMFVSQRIFEYLKSHQIKDIQDISGLIMLEDSHWDWVKKSASYNKTGYHWFFLSALNKIQAVALIFHPKASIEDDRDIYYIEYVSVAPWNRMSKIHSREFSGIGSFFLKEIQKFIVAKFRCKHGFSLHSLPQAYEYYLAIGMKPYPIYDKDRLRYLELSAANAERFTKE